MTFTPRSLGDRSATFAVSDGFSADAASVMLIGSGVPGKLKLAPKILNFGDVAPFATAGPKFVTLTNRNPVTLNVTSISTSPADSEFSYSGCDGQIDGPGGSCTISISFTPNSDGKKYTTLEIAGDEEHSPMIVRLAGKGFGAPVPTPTLTPAATPTPTPTPISSPTPTSTPTPNPPISGSVQGGTSPVAGSIVTLYAAGSSGYGAGATALASTTSANDGSFTLNYTCPSGNPQTYVLATGGDAGSGGNSAIGLMALMGFCGNLASSAFVTANPLTTVAAEWALAQFSDSTGADIGTSATNPTGFNNAVNLAMRNLTESVGTSSIDTGVLAAFWANSGATSSNCASGSPAVNCDGLEKLNTLANILAACVESSGPSSTPCGTLFSNTGGSSTTLQAAHVIAANPASGVGQLFAIQSSSPPFTPAESAAPNSWVLALNYIGGGLNDPLGIAVDAFGNVWVGNCGGATVCANGSGPSSLSEFEASKSAFSSGSPCTGGGLDGPWFLTIAPSGDIWIVNFAGNTLSGFNPSTGAFSSGSPYAGGDLSKPVGIASDASGNIWVANSGGDSLSEFNPSTGTFPRSGISGGGLGEPLGLAIDASGNIWVANCASDCGGSASSSLSEFQPSTGAFSSGSPYVGGGLLGPEGIAIDATGNVWAANVSSGNSGGGLSEFSSSSDAFSSGSPYSGGGMNEPLDVATDSSGDVWVTNFNDKSLSEFNSSGAALSPSTGYTGGGLMNPWGVAIDASGNVWASNLKNNSLTEMIGAARPVLTPMVACLKQTLPNTVCLP
jgi:streptogramin lyase